MASSIVGRVASGAALAASGAALIAAFTTILFATILLQRAEDRRLEDASVTLAEELGHDGYDIEAIRQVHRNEAEEMQHTGMLFAVYDARGSLLVGDRRVELPASPGCSTSSSLRLCRAGSSNGLSVVAGAAHSQPLPVLVGAALLAALLAAALAWAGTRPIALLIVAPLTRLRERIEHLDIDALSASGLGPDEQIAEVDALRRTIEHLVGRIERLLAQANRFAANAAHELRTPLTYVRAELELLAEGIVDADAREGANLAQRKLSELSVLVERLLILSVPAQSATEAHEVVSLRDLLEDAVQSLPTDARARVQVASDEALVRGDAALLGTMVANAIANGLKFGSTVTTVVWNVDGVAVLHVDDDGPGVEVSERESVFEPFFRGADAIHRRVPGHGLGLALIRHIATTHGGTAALVDKATRGARIEIRLPVA